MLYIDCFQLTKACLTAQWIVIRLKLHYKSFSFVLKRVLSPRVTGPKQDRAERHLFIKKHKLCEGRAASAGGTYPRQEDGSHDAFKRQHRDGRGRLFGKGERDKEGEQSDHYEGERVGSGEGGRETEGLGSIHVVTFPLNSCQGPSAEVELVL